MIFKTVLNYGINIKNNRLENFCTKAFFLRKSYKFKKISRNFLKISISFPDTRYNLSFLKINILWDCITIYITSDTLDHPKFVNILTNFQLKTQLRKLYHIPFFLHISFGFRKQENKIFFQIRQWKTFIYYLFAFSYTLFIFVTH